MQNRQSRQTNYGRPIEFVILFPDPTLLISSLPNAMNDITREKPVSGINKYRCEYRKQQ